MVVDVLGRMVDRAKEVGLFEGLQRVAELLGCGIETFPMMYLGLPLGGNLRGEVFWNPVVENIGKRLEGWSRALLSRGSRYTLVLVKVAKSIEKLMRDFLWEGKDEGRRDHLVNGRDSQVACAPLNVKLFMWILVNGGTLTNDSLQKRRPSRSKRAKVLRSGIVFAIFWVVWLERNARIFEGETRDIDYLWDRTLTRSRLQIPQDSHNSLKVNLMRSMHKLTNYTDSNSNIRTGPCQEDADSCVRPPHFTDEPGNRNYGKRAYSLPGGQGVSSRW
ncbi:hypothetical protein CsSME_00009000 [Camellia sinensis var. sinensis]